MLVLDAVAGKSYYLEVAVEPAKWKSTTPTIRQADEPIGAEEVFKAESQTNALLPKAGTKGFAELSARPKGVKD